MKIIDERLEQNKNKIHAECMQGVYILIVLSFLIKSLYFKMDLFQCFTEYIILVGLPIYQMVRSRQLGVVLSTDPKAALRPKTLLLTVSIFVAVFFLFWLVTGKTSPVFAISFIAVYLIVFFTLRILIVRAETKRIEKLEHKYDDEL